MLGAPPCKPGAPPASLLMKSDLGNHVSARAHGSPATQDSTRRPTMKDPACVLAAMCQAEEVLFHTEQATAGAIPCSVTQAGVSLHSLWCRGAFSQNEALEQTI